MPQGWPREARSSTPGTKADAGGPHQRLRRLPGLAIAQARFLYLNRMEGQRRTVPTEEQDRRIALIDSGVDAEQRLSSAEELQTVLAALEACPPRTRDILSSVYDEGITAAEASARLGISVQRVRQTLCEVRVLLRTALGGAR